MDEQPEQPKEVKKPKLTFFKYLSFSLLGIAIISLIVSKAINPDFKTSFILVPTIIYGVVVLAIVLGPSIINFVQGRSISKVDSLPDPISNEEAYRMVAQAMGEARYADKIGEIISEGSESIGQGSKSEIYHILFKGKMRNPSRNCYFYVINKHFPANKKFVKIYKENEVPSNKQQFSIKNGLSNSPESLPDVQEIDETNALTGSQRKIRITKYEKKNKSDEAKKAETLE